LGSRCPTTTRRLSVVTAASTALTDRSRPTEARRSGRERKAHRIVAPPDLHSGQLGGHKAQGRTAESARALIEDALALEGAGAQMLLLEAVPPEVGQFITERLAMPVLSIGAGMHCDGQLLIVSDMIGQFQAFTPKFVKKYCSVAEMIVSAMKQYCAEVRSGEFPADEHCYHMLEGEYEKFVELAKEYGGHE